MACHRTTVAGLQDYLQRGFTINGGQKKFALVSEQPKKEKRSISGRRPDLGNLYLRSTWEANTGRYLNFLQAHGKILRWEYEVDEFEFPVKRGRAKYYKPDFKVWFSEDKFQYWEVKGYMDNVSATKLKRMQRHYPQYEVIIIDEYRYRHDIVPLRRLLPGWEDEYARAA